jgi:hypothetical protein
MTSNRATYSGHEAGWQKYGGQKNGTRIAPLLPIFLPPHLSAIYSFCPSFFCPRFQALETEVGVVGTR